MRVVKMYFRKVTNSVIYAVYGEFESLQHFTNGQDDVMVHISSMKRFGVGTSGQAHESRHSAAFYV